MKKILELDLRMTNGDHNLIDLVDQKVSNPSIYNGEGRSREFESCEEVLDFITNHKEAYIDATGMFSKSQPRREREDWEGKEEFDHDGFTRIFCSQISYVMIVYANEDD